MTPPTRRRFVAAAGSLAMLASPLPLRAQARPVTLVVPYGAGGPTDALARILAEGMTARLGRPFIVDFKPGANGIIASTQVARAPADGSSILIGATGTLSLNILLRPSLAYGFDSFESVAMMFEGPLTITVTSRIGVNSIPELVAYARKENRPLTYASLGPGSVTDLYGKLMAQVLGIPLTAVAYKGTPPSLIDLIAGRNDLSFHAPNAFAEYMKRGEVKILAMSIDKRDPSLPEVPTVIELGYPKLRGSYWNGLFVAKGTPAALVQAYADAALQTMEANPKYRELLETNALVYKTGGPAFLDAQMEADRQSWGKLIKDNGIVLES